MYLPLPNQNAQWVYPKISLSFLLVALDFLSLPSPLAPLPFNIVDLVEELELCKLSFVFRTPRKMIHLCKEFFLYCLKFVFCFLIVFVVVARFVKIANFYKNFSLYYVQQ
jgi:hypothetical protein